MKIWRCWHRQSKMPTSTLLDQLMESWFKSPNKSSNFKNKQKWCSKANEDQMLAHAACNFEKKPGKVYHLWKRNDQYQWSMLSLDDHGGKAPRGSEFMGSYKFESDRSFTKAGSKCEERIELENFVNEMLASPNKAI